MWLFRNMEVGPSLPYTKTRRKRLAFCRIRFLRMLKVQLWIQIITSQSSYWTAKSNWKCTISKNNTLTTSIDRQSDMICYQELSCRVDSQLQYKVRDSKRNKTPWHPGQTIKCKQPSYQSHLATCHTSNDKTRSSYCRTKEWRITLMKQINYCAMLTLTRQVLIVTSW